MRETPKLTKQDIVVLRAIHEAGCDTPGIIARIADIRTSSPRETAARHCIKLTKLGLAQKAGTAMFPEWQITEAGRRALASVPRPSGGGR